MKKKTKKHFTMGIECRTNSVFTLHHMQTSGTFTRDMRRKNNICSNRNVVYFVNEGPVITKQSMINTVNLMNKHTVEEHKLIVNIDKIDNMELICRRKRLVFGSDIM